MKSPIQHAKWLRCPIMLLALLSTVAFGQSTPATETPGDDVIVLSPFSISADSDVGFVATSALAGGRLATELKDTPAAYSVLSREFIDALGVTDITEAAAWTVNASTEKRDGRRTSWGGTGIAELTTYRGVQASTSQIDFFDVYYDFDSYNLERYDFSRGPNSILFGAGSVGGTANAMYKEARTDKRFEEVQLKVGSWDYYRATADINVPLGDKLAVRTNLMWQDNGTWRWDEFSKKNAASLHFTYRPFENTKITGVVDTGEVETAYGMAAFNDRLSGWDGVTTYDAPLTSSPAASTGTTRLGSSTSPYYVFSPTILGGNILNWANSAATQGGGQRNGVPIGGLTIVGPSINADQRPLLFQGSSLPVSRFDTAISGSHFVMPSRKFAPVPTDTVYSNDYNNMNMAVEQQVGDHLFFRAAANHSSGYRRANFITSRGLANIWVDVNENLPNGDPNPYFLEPYLESTSDVDYVNDRVNNYRLNGALVFDDTRWGDFRFNAELGRRHYVTSRQKNRYAVMDPEIDSRTWINNTRVRWRYYYQAVDERPIGNPDTVTVVDPITNRTRSLPAGLVVDTGRPTQTVNTTHDFDYAQLAFNATLFDGKLNLLGAGRFDEYDTHTKYMDYAMDLPSGWNGTDVIFRPDAPANYWDLTYVPKDANGNPTDVALPADTRPRNSAGVALPQYANDVFRDDFSPPKLSGDATTFSYGGVYHVLPSVSIFGNFAETWSPPGTNLRIDSTLFGPVTSEGWDAGFRFSLLDDRIQASVTRYEGKQANLNVAQSGLGSYSPGAAINDIVETNVLGDLSASGGNARGLTRVPTTYQDTVARETSGYEFEVVANVTKGWRLLANMAFADANQVDGYADTRRYLEENDSILRAIVNDAGVNIDSAGYATLAPGTTTSNSPDAIDAATAYNRITEIKQNITSEAQKLVRLTEFTGNLFTDYTFQDGPLKDFRIGAGINYRGREVIDFRGSDTIVDPNDSSAAIDDPTVDAFTPVYRPSYYTTTLVFGYKRDIAGYPVRFDLTIDNALDNNDPIYWDGNLRPVNGNVGSAARVTQPSYYYNLTPRNFKLSATVTF